MIIRAATVEDWAGIWPILRQVIDEGESYALDEDLTAGTAQPLWFPPRSFVVVAVEGDEIIGSAKLVPNYLGRGGHVANASFIVAAEHGGKGVGRALGEHIIAAARAAGYRAMQFNAVVETNTVAVRLWQSLGFEILTTVPEAFNSRRHGLVGFHIMYQRLQ